MGTRKQRQRQEELWYRQDLAEAPGHPFYRRLNEMLDHASFDEFCEARSESPDIVLNAQQHRACAVNEQAA